MLEELKNGDLNKILRLSNAAWWCLLGATFPQPTEKRT